MSGSTIGGVAGGIIGFYFGGPSGAQYGFMIGSAVGGYVDPQRIEGPRITDAQTQTSMEGAPRTIVYGTCCVAGNLIQWGPLVEHKNTERQGKGGPKVTTYTYTRTVAIRICEAAPLGGTMKLRRVWMDDKLVYDVSARDPLEPFGPIGDLITVESQSFASILTFYDGSEDQLPDPSLEALDEEYGGGVGNVPAYRGTCYAVLTDLDCTDRQGSVPQFRWEVCSDATEEPLPGPTVGAETDTATLDGNIEAAYIGYAGAGAAFFSSATFVATGESMTYGLFDSDLNVVASATYTNAGDSVGSTTLAPRANSNLWMISADGANGYCKLLKNGEFMARLAPDAAAPPSWWYAEGTYFPEYGGLIWFTDSNVYIGVRKTGSTGVTYNRIYCWPLEDADGALVYASAASDVVTTGDIFYVHMDRVGTMRAIAPTESELITYDAGLSESRVSLPMSLTSLKAFAVDSDWLILLRGSTLYFYDLDTFTLQDTVALSGTFASVNHQIICADDSIFVRSGVNMKRVAYGPSCFVSAPEGWFNLPDTPNAFTNGTDIMPRCGAPIVTVTPGKVSLPAIVADIANRTGIDSDQFDLSALTGMEVRGYPVARQTTADAAIRELQQVFFFDLPEWGNSGDTGTKLRAVLRGGASVYTLTEDDLVDNDDDEDTRPQQVEYPRKVWATASDPEANYEAVSEPAERETENVKAVGEVRMATSVVLVRDEIKQLAEKSMKTRWAAAEGRTTQEITDALSQYTPSDVITFNSKRYRIDRTERRDGSVVWEMERDRASAATSTATGSGALSPTTPTGTVRGPTIFQALNLPSLRSADNVPGVYIAAQGLLPGWIGADIYLSVDGGVTEQKIATITDPATMGVLAEDTDVDGNDTSGLISVTLYNGGELDSITEAQMDARLNGFALTTAGVSEVGQFQYAEETSTPLLYDLSNVLRGQLGTTAAAHSAGDSFVLLDGAVMFVPIDAIHSGETLIFRAVSIGTAPANNPTTSIVFDPPTFIIDGGEVTP